MDPVVKALLEDLDNSCNYCFVGSKYFGGKNMSSVLLEHLGPEIPDFTQQDIIVNVGWNLGHATSDQLPHYRQNLVFMFATGIGRLRPHSENNRDQYRLTMEQICADPVLAGSFLHGINHEMDSIPDNDKSPAWDLYYQQFKGAVMPELNEIIALHWEKNPGLAEKAGRSKQDLKALPASLTLLLS